MAQKYVNVVINDIEYKFSIGDGYGEIPCNETLLDTLRNRLGLTAAKKSCDEGACGCCTVIKDGDAVPSCMTLLVECDGCKITTLEGLSDPVTGEMSELQKKFVDYYAFQCGFCTPGIIMTTKALLDKNPNPTEEEIKDALSGNYCRCISHYHVMEAVNAIAGRPVDLDKKWEGRR